eukprot:1416895-Rhodomonas_salina.2
MGVLTSFGKPAEKAHSFLFTSHPVKRTCGPNGSVPHFTQSQNGSFFLGEKTLLVIMIHKTDRTNDNINGNNRQCPMKLG